MEKKTKKILSWSYIILMVAILSFFVIKKILYYGLLIPFKGIIIALVYLIPTTVGQVILAAIVIWLLVKAIKEIRNKKN